MKMQPLLNGKLLVSSLELVKKDYDKTQQLRQKQQGRKEAQRPEAIRKDRGIAQTRKMGRWRQQTGDQSP